MTPPGSAPYIQPQPRLSHLSLRGLLSLPRRLCSPPAAVGKVRSFGLTPIFDVRLEDVLDRKHLPPLSLKDFEEWLLYVEQSVENLYFILWLREYTTKYDRWIAKIHARQAKNKQQGRSNAHAHPAAHGPATYRVAWSNTTPTSPALELFFSRARETFLVPGAPYEITLPPALHDALAVVSGHPDPAVFAPARAHVEDALRASLSRSVRAAYSNVGTYRAACGIAAGLFILIVGTVPPLAVNFVKAQSRWERLVILPGLWLGLTILLASLRGICMMIYIFGDFRQLRKFELVRPRPPSSTRSRASLESNTCNPATITAPTRPVQALTSPPKVAIRYPTRTPTLSYGTSTSITVSTDASFPGTGTQTSYTNTTSHAHTISISSVKSRGGTSSLVFPHHPVYADSETRSVPAYASDDEESLDDDADDDGTSTMSDHGIYISPPMPSPEAAAEDDPAVVNAALALIASGNVTGSTGQVSSVVVTPGTAVAPPPVTSVPSTSTGATTPATKMQTKESLRQIPTAPFIPTYPYSEADSIRAHGRCRSHSRSRSISKSGGTMQDLEAGVSSTSPEAIAPAQEMGKFDFDALPIPPAPPVSPAPVLTVPTSRPRAPETHLDTSIGRMDAEKGLMLSSPSSGYNLGLNTMTDVCPTSPALSDDAAALCGKDSGSSMDTEKQSSNWHAYRSRINLPFFLHLPRLFSLFQPRHHSHSHSRSSYSAFDDLSPYSAYTNAKAKGSWRTRCALEARVPAFGPVTRVLAPVVARAQWEIVVRAACLAALFGGLAAGVVVSLPVPGEA